MGATYGNTATGGGGGGAGGAGAAGANGASLWANAGIGVSSSITGSAVTRAVGGRGAGDSVSGPNSGGANTGSGGDGAGGSHGSGGAGGSGVIILRIPDTYTATFSGGVTQTPTTITGYKIYTITATTTLNETVTFS